MIFEGVSIFVDFADVPCLRLSPASAQAAVPNLDDSCAERNGGDTVPPAGFEPAHTAPEARLPSRDAVRMGGSSQPVNHLPRCYKAVMLSCPGSRVPNDSILRSCVFAIIRHKRKCFRRRAPEALPQPAAHAGQGWRSRLGEEGPDCRGDDSRLAAAVSRAGIAGAAVV